LSLDFHIFKLCSFNFGTFFQSQEHMSSVLCTHYTLHKNVYFNLVYLITFQKSSAYLPKEPKLVLNFFKFFFRVLVLTLI
jgi:hypothetical protein